MVGGWWTLVVEAVGRDAVGRETAARLRCWLSIDGGLVALGAAIGGLVVVALAVLPKPMCC